MVRVTFFLNSFLAVLFAPNWQRFSDYRGYDRSMLCSYLKVEDVAQRGACLSFREGICIFLPPGLFHISLCRWVYGRPILISKGMTEFFFLPHKWNWSFGACNQYNACQACEQEKLYLFGSRNCTWNTSTYSKSELWVCARNFIFGVSMQKRETAFKF